MNLIIVILVILIIDVIGGYFIGKQVMVPMTYERELSEGGGEGGKDDVEEGDFTEPGIVHNLEPINLNPANSMGEVFSCTLSLVAPDETVIPELTSRNDQIVDIILNYLSAKNVTELNDVTMREEYRKEMTERINAVITSGKIVNIYITQWILQM